jgi:GNAT superfamily N-acetyltransferase
MEGQVTGMHRYRVVRLRERNKKIIEAFHTGAPSIDHYLKDDVLYYSKIGKARTYLVVAKKTREIAAFFCISRIRHQDGQEFPFLPTAELIGIGVDKDLHGTGLGTKILQYIVKRERILGVKIISVLAIPSAVGFYKSLGFEEASPEMEIHCNFDNYNCTPMFLMI